MKKRIIFFILVIMVSVQIYAEHDLYAALSFGMFPPYQTRQNDYDITFPLALALQYDYYRTPQSLFAFSADLGFATNLLYYRGNKIYHESLAPSSMSSSTHFSIHTSVGASVRKFLKNDTFFSFRLSGQYSFTYLNAPVIPFDFVSNRRFDSEQRKSIKNMFGIDAQFFFDILPKVKSGIFFGVTFNFIVGDSSNSTALPKNGVFINAFKPYIGYKIGGTIYPVQKKSPVVLPPEPIAQKIAVLENPLETVQTAKIVDTSITQSQEELLVADEKTALLDALMLQYMQNLKKVEERAHKIESPIIINYYEVQGPDENGETSFLIEVRNISAKTIKSIQFTLVPYTKSGSIAFSLTDQSSTAIRTPDILLPGNNGGWSWLTLWSNSKIASVKIKDAHILFTDDSSVYISEISDITLDEQTYTKKNELERKMQSWLLPQTNQQ